VTKAGRDRAGRQQYRCRPCRHRFTARSTSAFCGFRFPDDIIAVAVRWYLRLRLPYADVVILLAERGVHVDPSTVFDWVQRFAPLAHVQVTRASAAFPGAVRADPRSLLPRSPSSLSRPLSRYPDGALCDLARGERCRCLAGAHWSPREGSGASVHCRRETR
jgi:hypothetical protein